MIPREKKPGECDCDWSGSCDEHAFVPPGARRLIETRAHAAGYEAAVRDMWRGALLVVAGNLEASARRAEASRDFAPLWTSWAADRRAEAAQLRAWAREDA